MPARLSMITAIKLSSAAISRASEQILPTVALFDSEIPWVSLWLPMVHPCKVETGGGAPHPTRTGPSSKAPREPTVKGSMASTRGCRRSCFSGPCAGAGHWAGACPMQCIDTTP